MDTSDRKIDVAEAPLATAAGSQARVDLSGQDRIVQNVLANWAGQVVFLAAGFIMPRIIDERIGQESLGIWDFGWSLVAYFGLVEAGVINAVNRFVARERAIGSVEGVNRAVSSATFLLMLAAVAVLALSIGGAGLAPSMLSAREHAADAQWVVFLLGASLAVQIAGGAFDGVLAGCHRWGLRNGLQAGAHAVTTVGMIMVLFSGGGLPSLALTMLGGTILRMAATYAAAHRVYRPLRVRPLRPSRRTARSMLGFGGKSFALTLADLVQIQAASLLIAGYLGPVSLAIFSRPRSLVTHVLTLVCRYSHVLGPTATSLHAMGRMDELRRLLLQGARFGAFIALPLLVSLAIMGGPLLHVWMGDDYVNVLLLVLLIVAQLPAAVQASTLSIIWGMNAHGRPAAAKVVAAVVAAGLVALSLGVLKTGLIGAAIAILIPTIIVDGLYLPFCACRRLDVPLWNFFAKSLVGPVLCALPLAMSLLAIRFLLPESPVLSLLVAAIVAPAIMAPIYWRVVLPEGFKAKLWRFLGRPAPLPAYQVD